MTITAYSTLGMVSFGSVIGLIFLLLVFVICLIGIFEYNKR